VPALIGIARLGSLKERSMPGPETQWSESVRRFGRYGLSVVMVIAPFTQVVFLLTQPWPLDSDDYVRDVSAHTGGYVAMAWLGLVGALTLAPAVIGVGVVAMRRAPLLGLVGMVLAVPGVLNPDGNPGDIIYTGARAGVPQKTVNDMLDRLGELPATGRFGFWAFAFAFAIGGLVLGVALLVGRSAPIWAATALILTTLTALVGSFVDLGGVVGVIGWAVATVGFTGCAIALVGPREPAPRARSDAAAVTAG
jgi:hypothetical protein